jgi:hypothetical protein
MIYSLCMDESGDHKLLQPHNNPQRPGGMKYSWRIKNLSMNCHRIPMNFHKLLK